MIYQIRSWIADRRCPLGRANDHDDFPFRSQPERLPSCRTCIIGVAKLRHGATIRRAVSASDRRHRHDAMPARIRGRHLRGPGLDGADLGGAGVAPVRPIRRLRGGVEAARLYGAHLSELRKPRRDRASWRIAIVPGRGRAIPMVFRSIRAMRRDCRRSSAGGAAMPAIRSRCASTWQQR